MSFIGLTGNLGMGKTTVLSFFQKLGAHTINADRIVQRILKEPLKIKKLVALLGRDILSGKSSKKIISKRNMADIIFNNPQKRKSAEKIIHPEVMRIAKDLKRKILKKDPGALIVFEVPLLFEAGYKNIFDKTIVVYCNKTKAVERLKKQGRSKEYITKRMQIQAPVSEKKKLADFLINNNTTPGDTRVQVKIIYNTLKNKEY